MTFTIPIQLPVCQHCGHVWLPESFVAALRQNKKPTKSLWPRFCAKCKTPNWNQAPYGRRGRPNKVSVAIGDKPKSIKGELSYEREE